MLALIFVGLAGCSLTFILLVFRPERLDAIVRARIKAIPKPDREIKLETLELNREESHRLSRSIAEYLKNFRFSAELELLVLHAGSTMSIGSLALTSVGLAMLAGAAAHLLAGPRLVTLAAAVVGGSLRYMLLRWKKSKRMREFDTALPDAIELMARALRAGHSMGSSIEVISEQSAEPLKGEFALCFQQQKFGIPFRDALLEMGRRVPSKDLHFMITAILVQKETGGDLTEILDRTTRVIRERIRIQGEVRTYTAQGRLTGWILGMLPVILLVLINLVSPGYSHILFEDPLGQKMLYVGGALIVLGGLIIRKIVDIQV
jgi:tight adherence protein B